MSFTDLYRDIQISDWIENSSYILKLVIPAQFSGTLKCQSRIQYEQSQMLVEET